VCKSTSRSTLKGSAASGIFQQAGFAKLLRLVPLYGTQPRSGGSARMRPLLACLLVRNQINHWHLARGSDIQTVRFLFGRLKI
jgi:hypothetical protein